MICLGANIFSCLHQVSGCEKFGYGVIVSQVAATAPGAAALQNSGNFVLLDIILLYIIVIKAQ